MPKVRIKGTIIAAGKVELGSGIVEFDEMYEDFGGGVINSNTKGRELLLTDANGMLVEGAQIWVTEVEVGLVLIISEVEPVKNS